MSNSPPKKQIAQRERFECIYIPPTSCGRGYQVPNAGVHYVKFPTPNKVELRGSESVKI